MPAGRYSPRRPAERFERTGVVRAKALFYLMFAVAAFLGWRLYVVQIRDGPALAEKAREQHVQSVDLVGRRGSILDRDGTPLVSSLPSQSVYATPREVTDPTGAARILGATLGLRPERIEAKLRPRDSYALVLIARKVPREAAELLRRRPLPGVSVVREDTGVRFAASGRLASTLIGFTGIDENGLDGVEYAYDSLLRGTPGKMSLETDQFGRAIPFAQPRVIVPARNGHGVMLTIDSYLQYGVERVLHETVAKWHAASGSAIVLDPRTGEILALANDPDYDVREYARFPPDAWRDRAVMDAYEPGSTFKLITAAAALESGKVRESDRFAARDVLQIGRRTIHNAEDGFSAGTGGSESLESIIAFSHNVGAAEVGLAIGKRTLYDGLRKFGFGNETRVGLPGESPGIVPALADWSATSLPTIAFGHGIATTPLALARAYAAIANGGMLLRPRILAGIVDADGNVVYRYGREVERRAISPKTAAILRRFLRAVVVRGTGNPTARVSGYTTAGKTGTAQVARNGAYVPGEYVASFVGMIPAESARYVILVKIENPRGAIYGSVVAAPAFAAIAKMAMLHAGVMPAWERLVRRGAAAKRGL